MTVFSDTPFLLLTFEPANTGVNQNCTTRVGCWAMQHPIILPLIKTSCCNLVKPGHIGIHKHTFTRSSENVCYLATQINRAPDDLCFASAGCLLHLLSERQRRSFMGQGFCLSSALELLLLRHQPFNVEQNFLVGDFGCFTQCVYPRLAPDYFYCSLQYMFMLALLKVI